MTPSDLTETRAIIQHLWPRSRWDDSEWSVFMERAAGLAIDSSQANAALRNLKAESDKYPTVAGLLKAMTNAAPRLAMRSPEQRADEPHTPEFRLGMWRKQFGLADDHPRGATTELCYRDAFARSVRLRGLVSEKIIAEAHEDLIEIAGFSPMEAEAWIAETQETARGYAAAIDTPEIRKRWAMMARMDKAGLKTIIQRKAEEAERAGLVGA